MDTLNILEQPGTFLNRFLNFTVLSPLTMEYGLISLECCTSQGDLQIEKGRNRLNRSNKDFDLSCDACTKYVVKLYSLRSAPNIVVLVKILPTYTCADPEGGGSRPSSLHEIFTGGVHGTHLC